jgi:hypothetical protein
MRVHQYPWQVCRGEDSLHDTMPQKEGPGGSSSEVEGSYIQDYWRKAPGLAWGSAWGFMRKHVWWELLILPASFIVNRLQALWAYIFHGPMPEMDLGREFISGLLLTGSIILITWLWHLIVVLPAKTRSTGLVQVKASQDEIESLQAKFNNQPDLKTSVDKSPNGRAALLIVTNSGGLADKLLIAVENSGVARTLHTTHYLPGGYNISLPKNGKHSIPIALVEISSGPAKPVTWRFPLRTHQDPDRSAKVILLPDAASNQKSVRVKLHIICHPENQKGPIEWEIVFQGLDFEARQISGNQ